jgi:hypothetical protein
MRKFKNTLTGIVAATLLAGSAYIYNSKSADTTNTELSLSYDLSSVSAYPTARNRTYSLQESSNLTYSTEWNETANYRGTESNLVYNINKDAPQKFYKVGSSYNPLYPKSYNIEYKLTPDMVQRGQGAGTIVSNDINVVNYDSSNLNVGVSWTELFAGGYSPIGYNINVPTNQTLIPGTNSIPLVFTWETTYPGLDVIIKYDINLNQ